MKRKNQSQALETNETKRKRNKTKLEQAVRSIPDVQSPPWIDLPSELTANIIGRLNAIDRLHSARKVCTTWRAVCKDYPQMWRVIRMAKSDSGYGLTSHDLRNLCRDAVYYGGEKVVDITINGFWNHSLLYYISKRCSKLQRLKVVFSENISGRVISEAVKKFPLLEELYLFSIRSAYLPHQYVDIEAIGRSCPMLKSFAFIDSWNAISDSDASAVVRSMPGLRHLDLFGAGMTENGLQAILDGCPQLESLDIRLCCFYAYCSLSEDIRKRCRRQLRQVWLPADSCSDHEFYRRLQEYVTSWYNVAW